MNRKCDFPRQGFWLRQYVTRLAPLQIAENFPNRCQIQLPRIQCNMIYVGKFELVHPRISKRLLGTKMKKSRNAVLEFCLDRGITWIVCRWVKSPPIRQESIRLKLDQPRFGFI